MKSGFLVNSSPRIQLTEKRGGRREAGEEREGGREGGSERGRESGWEGERERGREERERGTEPQKEDSTYIYKCLETHTHIKTYYRTQHIIHDTADTHYMPETTQTLTFSEQTSFFSWIMLTQHFHYPTITK